MPQIIISGIPGADGEYSFDRDQPFTNRELHIIKDEAGVRAGEIEEAWAARDNDLVVAIVLIMLRRAGKGDPAQIRDLIWDAPAGAIRVDLTDEERAAEDDGLPPTSAPLGASETNSENDSSGKSSNGTSELPPENVRPLTGTPSSDVSSGSALGISAS